MDFGDPVEALIPGVQGRVLTVLARTGAELTMRAGDHRILRRVLQRAPGLAEQDRQTGQEAAVPHLDYFEGMMSLAPFRVATR